MRYDYQKFSIEMGMCNWSLMTVQLGFKSYNPTYESMRKDTLEFAKEKILQWSLGYSFSTGEL